MVVKWHNAQLYDKLQVKNRRQAVIRAQTLGILKANTNTLLQPMQHNLPADMLPFIGRVEEIQELAQQLTDEKVRLVTILGAGGMGKTRLSIEVGRRLQHSIVEFTSHQNFSRRMLLIVVDKTEHIIPSLKIPYFSPTFQFYKFGW